MLKKKKYKIHIAAALLVLFVFSSVPKYLLHNFFSNHSHEFSVSNDKDDQSNTTIDNKVDCDCEDLYTEVFFVNETLDINFKHNSYVIPNSSELTSLLKTPFFEVNLRGPPAC